ncbi:hypothetical protein DDT52_18590 [Brenneria roseae subsp. roseae]|uniref:hypothetical protein n=1 Tax=Brenneria roseae TaxID=1509241 RepID=UPI000D61D053|nr:hypothetical protein [Brenneria roseae]PWC16219.1 hypothetical protein DDT52_18590 [Brenneria roseae subsp. roseae]
MEIREQDFYDFLKDEQLLELRHSRHSGQFAKTPDSIDRGTSASQSSVDECFNASLIVAYLSGEMGIGRFIYT